MLSDCMTVRQANGLLGPIKVGSAENKDAQSGIEAMSLSSLCGSRFPHIDDNVVTPRL